MTKAEKKARGVDWRAKRLHAAAGYIDAALSQLSELESGCDGNDGYLLHEVSRLRRVLRQAREHAGEARNSVVAEAPEGPAGAKVIAAWAEVAEADVMARREVRRNPMPCIPARREGR